VGLQKGTGIRTSFGWMEVRSLLDVAGGATLRTGTRGVQFCAHAKRKQRTPGMDKVPLLGGLPVLPGLSRNRRWHLPCAKRSSIAIGRGRYIGQVRRGEALGSAPATDSEKNFNNLVESFGSSFFLDFSLVPCAKFLQSSDASVLWLRFVVQS
jgi:hypothetical protein